MAIVAVVGGMLALTPWQNGDRILGFYGDRDLGFRLVAASTIAMGLSRAVGQIRRRGAEKIRPLAATSIVLKSMLSAALIVGLADLAFLAGFLVSTPVLGQRRAHSTGFLEDGVMTPLPTIVGLALGLFVASRIGRLLDPGHPALTSAPDAGGCPSRPRPAHDLQLEVFPSYPDGP